MHCGVDIVSAFTHKIHLSLFLLQGYVKYIIDDKAEYEPQYVVVSDNGKQMTVDSYEIHKFDYKNATLSAANNDAISYGMRVLAIDVDDDADETMFFAGQVIGRHKDGRYNVYFLNDGSFGYVAAHHLTQMPGAGGSFEGREFIHKNWKEKKNTLLHY